MPSVPKRTDGYGLADWLPADYLGVTETRALGELDLCAGMPMGYCAICGIAAPLERAHIVRRGMGGKPKGTTGPTVRLCRGCHSALDADPRRTLAVRTDGEVYHLMRDRGMERVKAQPLGLYVREDE